MFLSTVVASVGLEQDSVAILIGAMVIAPLLGPNVAFAFGAAIGDRTLMLSAGKSGVLGVVLSVVIAGVLAFLIAPNIASHELLARTSVDYAGIALALASGAAAALSVTTGLSATLVGVMVAVALLPPAVTVGIMLAAGRMNLAVGAAMLLIANIACVNLAAQLVFLAQGHQAAHLVRAEERAACGHRQHRHLDRADCRPGRRHRAPPAGSGLSGQILTTGRRLCRTGGSRSTPAPIFLRAEMDQR